MTKKELYYHRIDNGLCVDCGKPNDTQKRKCTKCTKRRKELREMWITLDVCPVCKKKRLYGGIKLCEDCAEKMYELNRISREKHGKKWPKNDCQKKHDKRIELKNKGLCTSCGIKLPYQSGFVQCSRCRIKDAENKRIKYARDSKHITWNERYSNNDKCVNCLKNEKYEKYKICKECYDKLLKKGKVKK